MIKMTKQFEYEYVKAEDNFKEGIQTWTLQETSVVSKEPLRMPPISFLNQVGKEGWELVCSDKDVFLFKREKRK